ncbi:MAG TPA: gamma-glutamyltransferase [Candidatus Acidoferrales bacterium]|nr:gamma-glutamyltransferase [Candidatus Acidoferrales bacterium]
MNAPKAGTPPAAWPAQAVRGARAMVASDEPLASAAGVEILKKGGNAVDAAVAVGFALAVVGPRAGNLGGGGFLLVRLKDGRTAFFDFREVAPGRASRDMYIRKDGTLDGDAVTIGYRAAGVPGTVAGLELALKTYGKLKLAEVMAPAIRLAEQGFPVSEKLARELTRERGLLERFPMSKKIFLKDGALYQPGEILRQPELAATLQRIARHGSADFYKGETARKLASEMERMDGLITLEDLANYKVKVREPLRASYTAGDSQWEVISSPPPSSGGVAMIEALNMLNDVPLKSWDDAQTVHIVAETMRRIFADRAAYLADPDFAHVPVHGLTDPRYAKEVFASIDPLRASSSTTVRAGNPAPFDTPAAGGDGSGPAREDSPERITVSPTEGNNTTHYSVVDAAGNAVSTTYTLNNSYGSGVTCSAGFLLNDEMDDFTTQPGVPNKLFGLIQSDANAIAPGKRPLSSMTPTILLRNGKLSFVTGSPGGPTIISVTLLSVLDWMRLGMEAQAAINAPRFHHQWLPDALAVEQSFPEEVARALEARGHKIVRRGHIGLVNAIGIDPRTGERLGAADPRDAGSAKGY